MRTEEAQIDTPAAGNMNGQTRNRSMAPSLSTAASTPNAGTGGVGKGQSPGTGPVLPVPHCQPPVQAVSYSTYVPSLPRHIEEARKQMGIRRDCPDLRCRVLRRLVPESSQTSLLRYAFEDAQMKAGNAVLFPESAQLMRFIDDAQFTVSQDSFRLPFVRFSISFPLDFLVCGRPLPGVLVAVMSRRDLAESVTEFVAPYRGHCGTKTNLEADERRLVMVGNSEFPPDAQDGMWWEELPLSLVGPILAGGEAAYANHRISAPRYLQDLAEGGPNGMTTNELWKRDHTILRLVAGLCVFCSAIPSALQKGFPSVHGPGLQAGTRARPHTLVIPPRFSFLRNAYEIGVDPFYRRAHFRELRDPRFRRNPDGSIRIVAVQATIVRSRPVDPHVVGSAA